MRRAAAGRTGIKHRRICRTAGSRAGIKRCRIRRVPGCRAGCAGVGCDAVSMSASGCRIKTAAPCYGNRSITALRNLSAFCETNPVSITRNDIMCMRAIACRRAGQGRDAVLVAIQSVAMRPDAVRVRI